MNGHEGAENCNSEGENRRAQEGAKRDGTEELSPAGLGPPCGPVGRGTRPGEDDGAEGEVLLSLHQEPDRRPGDEDVVPEPIAVVDVDDRADRGRHRDERRREADREMGAATAIAEHDRRMREDRGGEPPEMAVDVLGEPQGIERHRFRERYAIVALVQCAVHDDVETERKCADCGKPICDACAVFEIDGQAACGACGRVADERSRAVGSALLAFIGASYLATLAVCVLLFKPRPFVGGLAAVVAIAVGRALQVWLQPRAVTRVAPLA